MIKIWWIHGKVLRVKCKKKWDGWSRTKEKNSSLFYICLDMFETKLNIVQMWHSRCCGGGIIIKDCFWFQAVVAAIVLEWDNTVPSSKLLFNSIWAKQCPIQAVALQTAIIVIHRNHHHSHCQYHCSRILKWKVYLSAQSLDLQYVHCICAAL